MHHFACHGGYTFDDSVPFENEALIRTFIVGGKLGVNVFVLISGYFLIDKQFKWKKFIRLALQVFFYSSVIYLLFLAFGLAIFDIEDLFKNFFPLITNRYWFMSCYVILYVLSPFINKMIKAISKKEHEFLILFLLFVKTIITIFGYNYLSNVGWFITLYIVSAYLKKYNVLTNVWISLASFCLSFTAMIVFSVFLRYSVYGLNNIVCFVASVSLFNVFRNMKTSFHSKAVNLVSSAMLGVYLIHDNNFVRPFLWQETLECRRMARKPFFSQYAINVVIIVFAVCTAIELARIYLIEKPLIKAIKKAKERKSATKNIQEKPTE